MTAFEPPVPAEPPLGGAPVPRPVPGGPPRSGTPVAAALARLDGVHELPLHEQPDVYQAVHTELRNALAAIDDA